jgi:hypothetical protein
VPPWAGNPDGSPSNPGYPYQLKPASNALISAPSGCATGGLVKPATYYDYYKPGLTNNNYIVTGTIRDAVTNYPIKNAIIVGWYPPNSSEFTYSDQNGNFAVKTDYPMTQIDLTANTYDKRAGGTGIPVSFFGPGIISVGNLTLAPLTCGVYQYPRVNGINENISVKYDNDLLVFPNPSSSGEFNLLLKSSENIECDVQIFSAIGTRVQEFKVQTNELHKIDLSSSARGIYLVTVRINGKQETIKIVY